MIGQAARLRVSPVLRACCGWMARPTWDVGLLVVALAAAPLYPVVAAGNLGVQVAQSGETFQFDIPRQPLPSALNAFSATTGWQVGYPASLVRDAVSQAVAGTLTPVQALRLLLAGTGIDFRPGGAASATLVSAVPSPPASGAIRLAPVVVDARKRQAEDVQRLPDSVHAFGSRELEDSRTTGIEGVLRQTPNAFFEERTNGDVIITLRGNSTRNNNTDSGIGLYVDGAYNYIQGNSNNIPLFDIEQVSVLLGPQGTLYGRNAVGGAINVQTANPTDRLEAHAADEIGNFDYNRFDAAVNAPTENGRLRFRLAGFRDRRDPLFFNRTRGQDEDGMERTGGRFKVGAELADDLDAVFGVERIEQNLPGIALTPVNEVGSRISVTDIVGATERNSTRLSSDVKWAPRNWLRIRSITGMNRPDGRQRLDGDGTPTRTSLIDNEFDADQLSQELRFSSADGSFGPLSWLAGVNYFRDRIQTRQETLRLTDGRLDRARIDGRIDQYAAFAEGTYEVTDGLRLIGSLRFSTESKEVSVLSERRNAGATQFVVLFSNDTNDTYDRFNPGATIAYDWAANFMTYAKVATAYKSGGVNFAATPTAAQATFDPEDVTNYEIGARTLWFDDRLALNATLFHQDQRNLQLRTVQGATSFLENVGDGSTDGAELSLRARPAKGLDLSVAYGLLTAKFENAPAVQVTVPPGVSATQDVSGKRVPNVPAHTLNLAATYRPPLTEWAGGFVRAEHFMTGGGKADTANLFELDDKSSTNFSAGLEGDWFSLKLFINNAFDESYFEVTPTFGATAGSTPLGQRNVPRTFGIGGTLRW